MVLITIVEAQKYQLYIVIDGYKWGYNFINRVLL